MKNKKKLKQSNIGPTPEAIAHGEFVVEDASTAAGDIRFRRLDVTQLDRLLFMKRITPHHHQIGEEFLGILYRAKMIGVGGSNWNSNLSGGERNISERQATAYAEAGRVIKFLKDKGGDKIKDLILGILLDNRPIANATMIKRIVEGLEIVGEFFADRYGWKALPDLSRNEP